MKIPFNYFQRQGGAAGITFDGDLAHVVWLGDGTSHHRVRLARSIPCRTEGNGEDAETVGQELGQQISGWGIRESRWTVRLPPHWLLTARIEVPQLDEKDIQGFLELAAEREFALQSSELVWTASLITAAAKRWATLVAAPKAKIIWIEQLLLAAGIKPSSLSAGWSDSATLNTSRTALMLLAWSDRRIGLEIIAGGGVACIRSIERSAPGPAGDDLKGLVRELRLTLGQLPGNILPSLDCIQWLGPFPTSAPNPTAIQSALNEGGLPQIQTIESSPSPVSDSETPVSGGLTASWRAAIDLAQGRPAVLEFSPPKIAVWKSRLELFAGKRHRTLLIAAASILLLTVLSFFIQGSRLGNLQERWNDMKPVVVELEALQQKIRQSRPWYRSDADSLKITEQLTGAFPAVGDVWVKTLEIRDHSQVTCSGFAKNNRALLDVLDRLGEIPEVDGLQVQQVQGIDRLQFAFAFVWKEGRHD